MPGEGAPLVTSVTHGTRIDLLFTMSDNTRATDKRQMAKAKWGKSTTRRIEFARTSNCLLAALCRQSFAAGDHRSSPPPNTITT
jgi:hypothetical protein